MDWAAKREWAVAEHERRLAAPVGAGEREDLRLASVAGASWAAGLASLMLGDGGAGSDWLLRAAEEYATSWRAAPTASWGRPIAMIRCRLIAGDLDGARTDASAALEAGAADASGPIGGYCAALVALAGADDTGYVEARDAVLRSFEERDAFLEDVRVADTILVLDALARVRGIEPPRLSSALLPG